MDNKQYPKVRKEAIRQGWRVDETRKGEMFFGPDGSSKALWHRTPSDHRALDNHISQLRRGGLRWPPSKR